MIRWAASAIVCSPDEQNRLIVMPGTDTGHPPAMAAWRAIFQPVAPSGLAQPISTSSTSPGCSPARSIACLTTWPPIVAPCVLFNAPRNDLASPVRAVETITASAMGSPFLDLQARPIKPDTGLEFNFDFWRPRCGAARTGTKSSRI